MIRSSRFRADPCAEPDASGTFRDVATKVRHHPVGSGFLVAWTPSVHVDVPSLDVIVELDLEVDEGRLVVQRFTAERRTGGPPVTIDVLKAMPLVGLISRAAAAGLLGGLVRSQRVRGATYKVTPVSRHDLEELSPEEGAAVVYRGALFVGLPPTATVAEVLGLSHDVAAKRVQAARRAGLLEPTTKGRKGG